MPGAVPWPKGKGCGLVRRGPCEGERSFAGRAGIGADSGADINGGGQGQTVTVPYDYRHWPVSLLTCTTFTVMRMG